MLEVLKQVADLIESLEAKNAKADILNQQASAKKASWDAIEKKHQAAANQLAARERLVGKLEDLAKGQAELKEKVAKYQEDKAKLAVSLESSIRKNKELDEAIKAANDKHDMYAKKRDALEVEKAEIARKEKVRAELLNEIRKGL